MFEVNFYYIFWPLLHLRLFYGAVRFLFMLFKSVFLFKTWLDLQEGVQAQ